ncbi:hypothetical protein GCM10007079_02280 [Nocardiopsis terrae]|nr:hypothetical protein GCM10007079_02280 [Nocardiopsis terrae]
MTAPATIDTTTNAAPIPPSTNIGVYSSTAHPPPLNGWSECATGSLVNVFTCFSNPFRRGRAAPESAGGPGPAPRRLPGSARLASTRARAPGKAGGPLVRALPVLVAWFFPRTPGGALA